MDVQSQEDWLGCFRTKKSKSLGIGYELNMEREGINSFKQDVIH
jgi:hypothetical protein